MNVDFSQVNLQYLIQARDLAKQDPERAAILLDMPLDQARLVAALTPQELAKVGCLKPPLLILRPESCWWLRLFTAIREGRIEEIDAIMEHATLIISP